MLLTVSRNLIFDNRLYTIKIFDNFKSKKRGEGAHYCIILSKIADSRDLHVTNSVRLGKLLSLMLIFPIR